MPGIPLSMDSSQASASKKIHEDSLFFDKLVELVPAKFYFENEDDAPNWKYMHNKNKTPEARQAAKEGVKKAKRAKLDPSNYKSNLEIQKERAQQEDAARGGDAPATTPPENKGAPEASGAFQNGVLTGTRSSGDAERGAATHSELKQRLHEKIEKLKAKREMEEERKERKRAQKEKSGKDVGGKDVGGKDMGGKDKDGKKRKRIEGEVAEAEKKVRGAEKTGGENVPREGTAKVEGSQKKTRNVEGKQKAVPGEKADVEKKEAGNLEMGTKKGAEDGLKDTAPKAEGGPVVERPTKRAKPTKENATPSIQFNKLEIDDGKADRKGKKGKSGREQKKELLKKATKLQTELKEKAGTKEGQEKLVKHAWTASLKRASGEKVLDDPKLLKKSIKSEEKKREHSQKKWKSRKAEDRKAVQAKQEKRNANLKERSDAKKERKIQKREKKLLNPGRKKSA